MVRTYYYPHPNGRELLFTETPAHNLKKKIDRLCRFNSWSTFEYNETHNITLIDRLHGYIENNECFDNTSLIYEKEVADYEGKQKKKQEELSNFKAKINGCLEILEKLQGRCKRVKECKNEIARHQKTLEKGYIVVSERISGSKRKRRFKKNSNHRYLIDSEIAEYKEKIIAATNASKLAEAAIKYDISLENFFFALGDTPENVKRYASGLNNRFNKYGETVFLFLILEETIQKLDREKYQLALNKYSSILKVEEEEKIHKQKRTKNTTSFFIDENGNEVTCEENIEQIIYNLK